MLSILIPVYNQDVTNLVRELIYSANTAGCEYEIILMDDASTEIITLEENDKLTSYKQLKYIILNKNIGRAKIRNRLAHAAKYDRLLFLDDDSRLVNKNIFIKNYIASKHSIVSGGRLYRDVLPDSQFILHWRYGRRFESKTLKDRLKMPYQSFHSNNFLTSKNIILDFPFDESHEGYGYEDILFAQKLKDNNIIIGHIDNPIIHDSLDSNISFLHKTEEAIWNLSKIDQQNLKLDVRLLNYYYACNNVLTRLLMPTKNSPILKKIRRNLLSKNPSLTLFQLYKLIQLFNASSIRR